MMIADIKLAPQVPWVDSESLLIAYQHGKQDAIEGKGRVFQATNKHEEESYAQGHREGLSIVAMLAGSDVDILPDTLWATEETQGLPADLDFNAMLDDMRVEQVLTPDESASYNWGWLCWIIGKIPDKLSGWSLRGWQDANEQYSEARRAERQLFAQTVNPNWEAQ